MAYTLVYHPDIKKKDIPAINRDIAKRIERAIETRLTTDPQRYGAPLRRTLKGYWKLRVGDYRVVFRVVKNEVWIFGIMHRRDASLADWIKHQDRKEMKALPFPLQV